jgi:hypothetical protein
VDDLYGERGMGIPAGLVPIGEFLEVRPTDNSRLYAGGARPVLTADGWLNEQLDARDTTGTHLASADRLRTVSGSPPAARQLAS